jgi:hypothetical protein
MCASMKLLSSTLVSLAFFACRVISHAACCNCVCQAVRGGEHVRAARVQIRVAAQTAVLVKQLRAAWDDLMLRKVKAPTKPLDSKQQKVLNTIVSLVREDAKAAR